MSSKIQDEDLFCAIDILTPVLKRGGVMKKRQEDNLRVFVDVLERFNLDELTQEPFYRGLYRCVRYVVRKRQVPHDEIGSIVPLLRKLKV